MKWETIDNDYSRARVKGGWIVRHDLTGYMVYVPDPSFGWLA
jgi:hypothetical protein